MFSFGQLAIDCFVEKVEAAYYQFYGYLEPEYGSIIGWAGRLALENIANSDMLYHDVDHTMMVALAGQDILKGKQLNEGGITPKDWLHFMIALMCHDIGYLKGICRDDKEGVYVIDASGRTVEIPEGGTNAALTPYHVDRGKRFIMERFGDNEMIDAEIVASYIEMTRFPVPDDDAYKETAGYPGLVRAADFIGQLGDPNHLRKIPALFYEFEETKTNAKLGYTCPQDMREDFPKFFWDQAHPYIQDALRHLRVTQEGKQWIASMYAHVYATTFSDKLTGQKPKLTDN